MTDERTPMSTTPNLDDLPRGLRFLLRLSVLLVGAVTAVGSFGLVLLTLVGLRWLGVDAAICNMMLVLLSPGAMIAGIIAAMRLERFQERRLQASLVPQALEATTLSGAATSLAVPASSASVTVQLADAGSSDWRPARLETTKSNTLRACFRQV